MANGWQVALDAVKTVGFPIVVALILLWTFIVSHREAISELRLMRAAQEETTRKLERLITLTERK